MILLCMNEGSKEIIGGTLVPCEKLKAGDEGWVKYTVDNLFYKCISKALST